MDIMDMFRQLGNPPNSGWSIPGEAAAPKPKTSISTRELGDLTTALDEARKQLAAMDPKWGRANDAAVLDKLLTDKTIFTGDSPVRRHVDRLGRMAKQLLGPSAIAPAPAQPPQTPMRPPTSGGGSQSGFYAPGMGGGVVANYYGKGTGPDDQRARDDFSIPTEHTVNIPGMGAMSSDALMEEYNRVHAQQEARDAAAARAGLTAPQITDFMDRSSGRLDFHGYNSATQQYQEALNQFMEQGQEQEQPTEFSFDTPDEFSSEGGQQDSQDDSGDSQAGGEDDDDEQGGY